MGHTIRIHESMVPHKNNEKQAIPHEFINDHKHCFHPVDVSGSDAVAVAVIDFVLVEKLSGKIVSG